MVRSFLLLAGALGLALPVSAQSSRSMGITPRVAASHVDASGALAGRSPHRHLRPVAAQASCGALMHLPAGKLPTYGAAASDERCVQTRIASADKPVMPTP